MPIDLGAVRIDKLQTPFATIVVAPETGSEPIDRAKRLIISAVTRGGQHGNGMGQPRQPFPIAGAKPPTIEVVHATVSIQVAGKLSVFALTPEGGRAEPVTVKMENGRHHRVREGKHALV